jgi:hypothetical protein
MTHTYRESASPEKLLNWLLLEIKLSASRGSTSKPERNQSLSVYETTGEEVLQLNNTGTTEKFSFNSLINFKEIGSEDVT